MGRYIKFRVWDKVENQMLNWETLCNQVYNLLNHINGGSNWIYMQYTGLKDKNGKEIQEGDLVKVNYDEQKEYCDLPITNFEKEIGEVYYSSCHFAIKIAGDYLNMDDFISHQDTVCLEVIGNIYENKELLK